jgi:hypothetical protein
MTQSTGDLEPHEGIDPYDNAETRAAEDGQTNPLGRAANGGPPPTDAPEQGVAPVVSGTGAGSPIEGVQLDEKTAAEAVSGDTGPEHPGVRRSS